MSHKKDTLLGLISACLLTTAALASQPELIPREVIFGNPTQTQARLSPDGTRLSYLGPSDEGVLNVWVRSLGGGDAEMVTNDTHRGIRIHFWSHDNLHLLYLQDVGGDENWHVNLVNLETKQVRDLTPFHGVRAENVILDRKHPGEALIGMNIRDRRFFDMYRVDLKTGAVELDTANPGDVAGWLTDAHFQVRAALASNPQLGNTILRVRDTVDDEWRDLITWPFGENGDAHGFTADGRSLIVETSIGSDTTRLVEVDAATGEEREELAHDERVDVWKVMQNPETHVVEAVSFNYAKGEWKVLDDAITADFDALAALGDGEFSVAARDTADNTWIVGYERDDGPLTYYSYERATRKAEKLFVNRPELEKYELTKMTPVIIESRDARKMVSYLSTPVGSDGKNLPMVLQPHGGPWARDQWGYDGMAQWLANRGYAVLQVNFRGSVGFGKEFLNAGNGEWGRAMQNDLTDAVRWAIDEDIADPERVCILGGSYGGYATLAGLTFTPELYECGVDIVGPSHIKTLFEAIPPYWEAFRKQLILRVGDVENDQELNERISPLFHVDEIEAALLIGQGANDPRVNIAESDQIVEAMRAKKLPVEYVVYTDEGHGFARPVNRLDFYGRAEAFLAKHLGGRAEPLPEAGGASVEVR